MKITIQISDNATPALRALLSNYEDRAALHAGLAMTVERLILSHIRENLVPKPNKLGGKTTGFWKKAADSVAVTADASQALVSIRHRGTALQYYGGTVRPVRKNWLTIPVHALAHGKSAAEFGRPLYRFTSKKGNQLLAINPDPQASTSKPGATRRLTKAGVPRKPGGYRGGTIVYLLAKSATIRPHPEVLPTEEAFTQAIREYLSKK